MKSNIEVRFLTGEEMENARNIDWRYEHVSSDNCGFADPVKNRVFVRAGLSEQLTKYLIDHEVSHLYELEGTHEDEHGIRHKGGFWKALVPILGAIVGSILLPGAGTFLGGGLGSVLGGATGVGLGAGLGGVAGSSAVGKPNWLENTIRGVTAGADSGLGNAFGSATGSGIGGASGTGGFLSDVGASGTAMDFPGSLAREGGSGIMRKAIGGTAGGGMEKLFTGALGQGQSAQGGFNPTSSGSSFKMPDMNQQQNNNPSFSGWSSTVGVPDMPGYMGQSGSEALTNSRGMGGLSKMPMDPGLGQAGINLSNKNMGTGFGQGFNQIFSGQQMNPMDFNNQNSLSF
jgi:hypothetical protein